MQPKLIIVAGPNGSGKTTFVNEYLKEESLVYLGADAIAYELNPQKPDEAAVQAGRIFLRKFSECIKQKKNIMIESTLSGLLLQKHIQKTKKIGYRIDLVYIFLDSPELCIDRIEARVAKGGHFVPPEDVRRRFERSYKNFDLYKKMASNWALYYNMQQEYEPVAIGEGEKIEIISSILFKKFQDIKEKQ